MKVLICFIAACLCITMPPLSAQDIESTLSGNTVNQGFTVKDGNGMPLFTVRGEGSVGIGTTLPTAVLTVSGLDGFLVKGTSGSGSIPTSGAGTRLMFYPKKAAFRAGEVTGTQWSDGNIGTHSTATGYNTTASGDYSTAIGHQTNASGRASTAMGYLTTVSGAYATAIGDMTNASGDYSTAIGALTVASGEYATATGYSTTASGSCSTAMGNHTTASGNYSTAIGNWVNTGSKMGSCVIGDNSTTTTFSAGSVNRFYGRFANGYCLYTNSGCSIAAILYGNANSWSTLSDVRKKEGFLPADGETI
ncbi:MAG: hypothetical protein JXA28_03970, partial [Bacteroidetes bacterium]|nr:hypothetical protein [Bacteroidota bacterium]